MPLILRQKLDHLAPGDSVDRGVNFLLLDDLGYLPQGPRSPRCSSTLIAERYERRSLGITSNLVYSEWERLRQPHGHRRSHRTGGSTAPLS